MKIFAVFSGFLGSGKTTTMMALTKHYSAHHAKAAMISNDLGGPGLADDRLARLAGCNASELTGECICYQTENLVARLDSLFDSGCELVISDIPGFGVGALEHVYHTLHERFPGRYTLAPFTVLLEPRTAELLMGEEGCDLHYILNTQLLEADLIVLNKKELLTPERLEEIRGFLSRQYPQAALVCISALSGEGLEELSLALRNGEASLRRPDIGYGGAEFGAAMGRISEYYLQYHAAVCCNDFDANAYLLALAEKIREDIRRENRDIPHLKLLAWTADGDYGKADLLGSHRPVELSHGFGGRCTELAVVLNGSAVCPADRLDAIITGAVEEISPRFDLEWMEFKKECFGMGE